jgi:hypothetical protein
MTAIDPDLQKLIDESERLMAEAEGLTLDAVCRSQGADPHRVREVVQHLMVTEAQDKAQEELAQDRQDIQREVEAEAARRGLKKPAPAGMRRRLGQMV